MTKMMIRPNRSLWARDFDQFFDDFLRFPRRSAEDDSEFVPRVNIHETKDDVRLTFELPGMEKKDIKVTMDDGTLTVSGTRELKREVKEDDYVRSEISSGAFCRSFTLPETVNHEKISADYKNGMLEVTMPKLEEVKPKQIEVKVA